MKFNVKLPKDARKKTEARTANTSKSAETMQGGHGYDYKTMMNLYSILTTEKFDRNSYYMTTQKKMVLLQEAVRESVAVHGAEFTAKLITYVRSYDGHRTSTHIAAIELMNYLSGEQFAKYFFSKRDRKKHKGGVVFRVDDALEMAAAYFVIKAQSMRRNLTAPKAFSGITLPNAMRKGFKKALESADWHELAKYQSKGKLVSLVDLINLTHPEPQKSRCWKTIPFEDYETGMSKAITKKNKNKILNKIKLAKEQAYTTGGGKVRTHAFEASVYGWLKQMDTAEDRNTKLGQDTAKKVKEGKITKAEAEKELTEGKAKNYHDLIDKRKLGYFALLRQLRAIHDLAAENHDADLINKANAMLIDEKLITSPSNLVWPFHLEMARDVLMELKTPAARDMIKHLDRAYDLACGNLEQLGYFGKSAVVLDTSGSMQPSKYSNYDGITYNKKSPIEIGALIAATLARGVNADLYEFSNTTAEIAYNPSNTAMGLAKDIVRHAQSQRVGISTNMCSMWDGSMKESWGSSNKGHQYATAIKPVDRVFIISDMQNGVGGSPYRAYQEWMRKNGLEGVKVYLINVNSYGTTAMPDSIDPNIFNVAGYSYEMLKTMIECETNPNVLRDKIEAVDLEPTGSW
jgi:hypothetical protein